MLHRSTAIALLLAAALTAPAAFATTPAPMAGHCDSAAAAPTEHDGMHHAPAARGADHGATAGPQDQAPCAHCAATTCLTTSHCSGGNSGLIAAATLRSAGPTALAIEPSAERRAGAESHAPPTPPPLAGPIAS